MNVQIKKWGNSASVRIPASILQAAHLAIDANVDIREEDGRIVIEAAKKRRPRYTMDDLLAGMTEENQHDFIETGPMVGKEIW